MSTSELKSNLHQLIDNISDQSVLEAVYTLLSGNRTDATDWWDALSEDQKKSIELGLKDAEDGRTIPHDEVMQEVRNLLKKHE
jgi:predicted transcriptional regulator